MQFNRLRLIGFKSFVEPTELKIEPGLTGVVGPNGCGKSNLVEALRWVMGETSARRMRGGEMDDIIFGGTANRPSRNVAEVVLELDNAKRDAPAAFNDSEELEIARRIDRGEGSQYRINGREVRARDVQLLFADQATGAHSTAMVSQDRVGALISAKPVERRLLLEEAAGITGLHSRRHEAELRLNAAEANLTRLDDVLTALDGQLQNIKRQARQASRYRNISGHIRRNEAALLYRRMAEARAGVATQEEKLKQAVELVAELTQKAAAAATSQADIAAGMPALRQAEAAAAAELQRLTLARGELESEEARVASAQEESRNRLEQVGSDLAREEEQIADGEQAVARLDRERAGLAAEQEGEAAAEAASKQALQSVEADAAAQDQALTKLTEEVAAGEARRADLERRAAELTDRAQRLSERMEALQREAQTLAAEEGVHSELESASAEAATAEAKLDESRRAGEVADLAVAEARAGESRDNDAAQQALSRRTKLAAEEQALVDLLGAHEAGLWPPVIDAVTVAPGYEPALAAALGDDLSAPTDEAAPMHWRTLPALETAPALPGGVPSLGENVRGPEALRRRMAQIGVVADPAQGRALQPQLQSGQRLVTREGALWRWDGYSQAADAASPAATRLKQRNRLREVAAERTAADRGVEIAGSALAAAKALTQDRLIAERAARDAVAAAFSALAGARERQAELSRRAAAHSTKRTALAESVERAGAELTEARKLLADARAETAALSDLSQARDEIVRRRAELAETRMRQAEAKAALDRLLAQAAARRQRLESIAAESRAWTLRLDGARAQRDTLVERQEAIAAEIERLSKLPVEIARRRAALMEMIDASEAGRRAAADRLAEAEERLAAADKELKAAETVLGEAREDRVRAEAGVTQAEQAVAGVAERIREKFECRPEDILAAAEVKDESDLPGAEEAELKLERLVRERDNMGPVNLRAEEEANEMEQQIAGM